MKFSFVFKDHACNYLMPLNLFRSIPDHDYYKGMTMGPIPLPYIQENPLGESVCWNNRGTGYFTLGEGVNATLYYYHRNGYPNPIVGK